MLCISMPGCESARASVRPTHALWCVTPSACASAGGAADGRAMASGAAARLRHRRLVLLGVIKILCDLLGRLPGTDPRREVTAGGGQAVRRSVPVTVPEGHVRAGDDQRNHRVDGANGGSAVEWRPLAAGHSPAVRPRRRAHRLKPSEAHQLLLLSMSSSAPALMSASTDARWLYSAAQCNAVHPESLCTHGWARKLGPRGYHATKG